MFRFNYHVHSRNNGCSGCVLGFGFVLVIGAIIEAPLLILPTIVIVGLCIWAAVWEAGHK